MTSHDHDHGQNRERVDPHPVTREGPTDEPVHVSRLDEDEPIAMAVVHVVATALRRQPLDLEPLSAQIDPEALENLLNGPIGRRDELSVSFRFEDCTVVLGPRTIAVYTE
jgi:hypothetical protein